MGNTALHGNSGVLSLRVRVPNFPEAACRGGWPEDFFPDYGDTAGYALEMCSGCPERLACLQWALEHREWGIWGGTTDDQRHEMRRGRG